MNKIWLWFFGLFSKRNVALSTAQILENKEPQDISNRKFLYELKRVKNEIYNPQLSDSLKRAVEDNIVNLVGNLYKKAVINNSTVFFITQEDARQANIDTRDDYTWIAVKSYIIKYLASVGIEASHRSDWVSICPKDIDNVIDSLPDQFLETNKEVEFSTGIYR